MSSGNPIYSCLEKWLMIGLGFVLQYWARVLSKKIGSVSIGLSSFVRHRTKICKCDPNQPFPQPPPCNPDPSAIPPAAAACDPGHRRHPGAWCIVAPPATATPAAADGLHAPLQRPPAVAGWHRFSARAPLPPLQILARIFVVLPQRDPAGTAFSMFPPRQPANQPT